jgi:hypothetical protein
MNTAVEGGGIAFTFKPVNGDTGISAMYQNLMTILLFWVRSMLLWIYKFSQSATELNVLVAQGDIGQNS